MSDYLSFTTLTPDSINNVNKIIDADKYNGRINILQPPNPNARFEMMEKINMKTKMTSYSEALAGNLEDNVLSQVYFSKENMKIIQNGIRAGVYKLSKNKIIVPPQNTDTLKIIMRSTYLQYAKHYETDIRGQVQELNQLVLDYAIPYVFNEAIAYVKYCEDQSTMAMPMDRPLNHDRVYKQLELKQWF